MIWTNILGWVQQAFPFAAFLALAALGELLTEKSGSLNLGTPGTMCVGASAGFIAVYNYCQAVGNPAVIVILLLALGVSFCAAMLMGLLYSFFTVSLRINQNVVGLVLTIFGCGLAEFLSIYFVKSESGNVNCDPAMRVFNAKIPFLSDKLGWFSDLFFQYGFMLYATIVLVILASLFLNRTRTGLHLRAVGENPGTADAAGINVTRYRYLASSIGAGLVGIAGISYVMEFQAGSWSTANVSTIEASGWLSVALVIFALWRPLNLLWCSLIFGFCYWAYIYLPAMGVQMADGNLQSSLLKMLPYVITILVLIIVNLRKSKKNQGPASLGLSYFREER
ncbi:MAG: ABC transporter permease [Oscillospiraceae bacterium]|nr:ABC transporter permease [Oscillospiraceae bacterium]